MNQLERALKKAQRVRLPNTRCAVLHIDKQVVRGVLILRPDQEWMTAQLRERKIPYIVATEIWPEINHANPVLGEQLNKYELPGDKPEKPWLK